MVASPIPRSKGQLFPAALSTDFILQMFTDFEATLQRVQQSIHWGFDNFQQVFAPIPEPEDDDRLSILLDILGFVTTAGVSRLFNAGKQTS